MRAARTTALLAATVVTLGATACSGGDDAPAESPAQTETTDPPDDGNGALDGADDSQFGDDGNGALDGAEDGG